MKQRIYFLMITLVISLLLVTVISAQCCDRYNTNNKRVCQTSYQIRPGNQINEQFPHFKCCKCVSEPCECECSGENCKTGDRMSKHIVLTRTDDCGTNCKGSAESDINVYNYNERDKVGIVLRTMNLMPRNTVYTVWLVNSNNDSNLYLGEFKTNRNGRATFTFKQQMEDFSVYEQLVVMNGDNEVLMGNLDFKCTGEGDSD